MDANALFHTDPLMFVGVARRSRCWRCSRDRCRSRDDVSKSNGGTHGYKPSLVLGKLRLGSNVALDSSAKADHDFLVTRNQYLTGIQTLLGKYTKP